MTIMIIDDMTIFPSTPKGFIERRIAELKVAREATADPDEADQYRSLQIDAMLALSKADNWAKADDGSTYEREFWDFDKELAQVMSEIDD